ncbi:protein RRP6-like 3 isoform X2 [Sorghum bicolor]|uniref:protein RRP6-like 3 isoform X2 n=1 Tax=Sorghum bicolor TaxID=4558 RepID=UPI000B423EC3|nr:protein RRP6-like 3 isoform X2 [Sorghum bicolor]|eukprot:XP_021308048.1 protein RRP6-like 3 isoform X2 [Sorghum bicolor]
MRLPKSKRSKSSYPFSVFSLPSPSDCLCLRRDMPGAATLRSRAAVAAAACLAVLAAAALLHRRRRRNLAPFSSRRLGVGGRPRRACEEEEKPQARFKRVLADNSYSPFKHLRRQSAQPGSAEGEGPLPPPQESSQKVHPFEEEITSLLNNPPDFHSFMLGAQCPKMSTTYNWVDTEAQLEHLARLLGEERAFAVDTEQHSIRSFLGYTALMQISTQNDDYLIDTIALHDVMGILRPVFANSSICKIFHGADNDVLWLQRDFHIYVVNMFDTAKACETLSKPQKSLAYLLEVYCEVTTDKTMQREDWRLRPLTPEMIEYARTDAHYLLYIANCLASELHAKACDTSSDKINFFFEASHRSNMVCMQLYAKEIECPPGASSAASILSRNLQTHGLDSKKSSEVKDLVWKFCAWRDLMARMHDESLRYVLSDQAIAALAVSLPKGPTEVFAVISETDLSISNDITTSMEGIFKSLLEKYKDPSGLCRLSVYNYNLITHLSLKQTNMFSFAPSGEKLLTAPPNKKASRDLFIKKFSCKSPVYHNCRIYASDGRLLCYCDHKKLEWYVQRNLAKLIEDSPPAIMLLFEPKGRPEDEDNEFYIQSKKNICVGCGEKSHYIRYRIIPSCYRMHFPEHLKSHRSHDIVLLCVDCHEIAHSAAEKYKRRIAEEFGIPLFVQKIMNSGDISLITSTSVSEDKLNGTGVSPLQLRTAAMALLRHGSTMPLKRCEELMQIVKSYYGGRDVTPEDLEVALLVGMSPHERRRLEKKKGYSFRAQAQNIIRKSSSNTISEDSGHGSENSHSLSERFPEDGTESNGQQEFDETESQNQLENLTLSQVGSSLPVSMEDTTFDHDTVTLKTDTKQQARGTCTPGNSHVDRELSIRDNSSQAISKNAEKKISLLGHGHHGKQVVELLLSNGGEEAINQFCQRWRQIFVEAVHPRYLPSGWNINHSGRRDFGDFSVYKPPRKDAQSARD